jgi:hypothetical protein
LRDLKVTLSLTTSGWNVIRLWECQLKSLTLLSWKKLARKRTWCEPWDSAHLAFWYDINFQANLPSDPLNRIGFRDLVALFLKYVTVENWPCSRGHHALTLELFIN